MAPPTQEDVAAFMSVTGSSEPLARGILEEHGGNLHAAIHAHFSESERNTDINQISMPVVYPRYDYADTRNSRDRGLSQLLSAGRSFMPSSLLDSTYRRNLYSQIGSLIFRRGDHRSPPVGLLSGNAGYEQHPVVNDGFGNSSSHFPAAHASVSTQEQHLFDHSREEEEMIRIAIEASKHENSSSYGLHQAEDDEFACVMALSLESAEEEKALRERTLGAQKQQTGNQDQQKIFEEANSGKEKVASPSLNEGIKDSQDALWGNISTEELDEAVLLEAAFFGEMSEGKFQCNQTHGLRSPNKELSCRKEPHRPSGSLVTERLLQEQQDSESNSSLLADGRKETSALKMSREDLERILATKEASLPPEPTMDDENTITLVIHMPDGKRCGRRFLKSHKLQFLFNFIDAGRAVKPGTYRVVRQYPKMAFGSGDCTLSLEELGLTSKQEVLFLELI